MSASQKNRLAELIVRREFGEPAEKVVHVLLWREHLEFGELYGEIAKQPPFMSALELKQLLLMLISHRVVYSEERRYVYESQSAEGGAQERSDVMDRKVAEVRAGVRGQRGVEERGAEIHERVVGEYQCDVGAILQRLRYMRYVDSARRDLDPKFPGSSTVLRSLLFGGITTLQDLEDRAGRLLSHENANVDLHRAVSDLQGMSIITQVKVVQTTNIDCPGPLTGQMGQSDVFTEGVRVRRRETDARRGRGGVEMETRRPGRASSSAGAVGPAFYDVDMAKLGVLNREEYLADVVASSFPAWYELVHHVMRVVLEATAQNQRSMTRAEMTTRVIDKLPPDLKTDDVLNSLDRPLHEFVPALMTWLGGNRVARMRFPNGLVCTELSEMLAASQLMLVEAYIKKRFGERSLRIFRIISSHRYLELKAVSDYALIDAKETRQRLYQLLEAGMIQIQEIPRSSERNPNRTFFLWTLRFADTLRVFLQLSWFVQHNLMLRLVQLCEDPDYESQADKIWHLHMAILENDRTIEILEDPVSKYLHHAATLGQHDQSTDFLEPRSEAL